MPGEIAGVALRWGRLRDGRIMLRFRVDGCQRLKLPAPAAPVRTDELWRTTCFELFLADGGGLYREFNFSPSGQWAAYAFSGYRNRIGDHEPVCPPEIAIDSGPSVFTLTAFLAGSELDGARSASPSAVLEEERGRLSYWALRHPGLKPDFHNPACFVAPLPPPLAP